MPPQQPPENEPPSKLVLTVFWAVTCGLSCAVTLPVRYGEGIAGVGRNGFFAVLVIILYALLVPCPPLLTYGIAFMVICGVKRLTTQVRHRFGNRQMSGFEGWPLACLIGLPRGFCKQVVEPGMIYALGWYLRLGNPPLGCFFIAGAVGTGLKTLFETVIQRNRDRLASDLRIQMEIDARRRARRGW